MISKFSLISEKPKNALYCFVEEIFLSSIPKNFWVVDLVANTYRDVSIKLKERENKNSSSRILPLMNPFVPNVPFFYLLKSLENLAVFWCFQWVEKGCIGNKWVKSKITKDIGKVYQTMRVKLNSFS